MSQSAVLDFSKLQFLIADGYSGFRDSVKSMLESFGAQKIDLVATGDDAISKMELLSYDVILCEYDLGVGKNGLQILEYMHQNGKMQSPQVFIMITGENSLSIVAAAIEYELDDYILKPFDRNTLYNRIHRSLTIKKSMLEVYAEIIAKNLPKALDICNTMLENSSGNYTHLHRLKGELLLQLGKYEEVISYLQGINFQRQPVWLFLQKGQSLFHLGDYAAALTEFKQANDTYRYSLESYDWLAKTLLAKKEYQQAQEVLEQAVQLSDKAILRQQQLADLATANNSWDIAIAAYKKAIELGKESCHKRPDDYIGLAKSLLYVATRGKNVTATVLAEEAIAALEILKNSYKKEQNIILNANLFLIEAKLLLQQKDKAKSIAKEAYNAMVEATEELEQELLVKLKSSLEELGEQELASKVTPIAK